MDYAVTAQQMKAVDQNTIKNIGIPSMVLMERAALAVAEAAEHMAKERNLGKKARILGCVRYRKQWRGRSGSGTHPAGTRI